MYLAYVDKIAKGNNCQKYVLVYQDLFDRTAYAKGMKTQKLLKKRFVHYWLSVQKNRPTKIWVNEEKICRRDWKIMQSWKKTITYSTRTETKAAFAERSLLFLKRLRSSYMKGYGYKNNPKLSQFLTTLNFGKKCVMDSILKNIKNSQFLSSLHSKSQREYRKPKFNIGEKVRIWKYDFPPKNGYEPQSTQAVFENVSIFCKKTSNIHKKSLNRNRFSAVNFITKNWSKSFNNGIV